jgi:hypothetical protein
MAASGFTPISLYYSATAAAVPLAANLVAGELALNTLDGKLYYKNSSNVVTLLASNAATTNVNSISFGSTGLTPSTATTGAVTVAGTLATTNGGTALTSFTSGGALYATSTSALTTGTLPIASGGTAQTSFTAGQIHFGSFSTSASLFWDNTNSRLGVGTSSPTARIHSYATSGTTIAVGRFEAAIGSYTGTSLIAANTLSAASTFNLFSCIVDSDGDAGGPFTQFLVRGDGNVGISTSSPTSMLQTAGSSSVSAFKTPNIAEVDTISATAATGTINYDVTTQSVLYYTSNASGNWTLNFRGSSGTSLNTVMQTGESISATFLVTNGSTAYYNSAVTIDGTSVTPKWQGGTAPTSGNASSTDAYTYVIQKTGSATYVVLASQTKFA